MTSPQYSLQLTAEEQQVRFIQSSIFLWEHCLLHCPVYVHLARRKYWGVLILGGVMYTSRVFRTTKCVLVTVSWYFQPTTYMYKWTFFIPAANLPPWLIISVSLWTAASGGDWRPRHSDQDTAHLHEGDEHSPRAELEPSTSLLTDMWQVIAFTQCVYV